ncbi:cytochrome d ubiquinol oxidase subunit II [Methylocapsa polymorpha]|uniref:Cytochrome d ubiquinol oxidase subunit II n=1 Tax=Methylocapsa polymorpha TaxID=3080828 RepID=A0ABZ0HRP5_9HYPH|nr:cytochrome d ubiquinol oxidase subunit II [Methylocapsa sp. RX1]
MTQFDWYLPVIWTGVIATAVAMYVILDGFDLGLGVLFLTTRNEKYRDAMTASVAPFWDGNETWLVLGGGGLLAAFPLAYSIIMPALYIPVILMLLALILRGVAFEFRLTAKPKWLWDLAFSGGSIVAAFAQGLILGGLLQGVTVNNDEFSGGPFDWLSLFSLMSGFGLIAGYGLLGACWLILKTGGDVQRHARRLAPLFLVAVALFIALVSIWTPIRYVHIGARWFATPNIYFLWPLPLATAALIILVWLWIARGEEVKPFVGVIGIFLLCFLGLAISSYPYLVPPSVDLWQAAAAPASLKIMLIGVAIMLPLILGYTAFVYWTFRGKLREGESYH